MDIITAIFLLLVGGFAGWKYREYTALKLVKEFNEQQQKMSELVKKVQMKIKVESSNGQYFAYCDEQGDFLAQGDSWKSLSQRLVERFPGKKFIMDEDNLKEQGYYDK